MKPFWKWGLGIAAGLIVFIIGSNWYVNHRWKPRMEVKLKDLIARETDGRYQLNYDRLEVSLLGGNAAAVNVSLIPDTATYKGDGRQRPASGASYLVRISRLQVKGVGLMRLLISKKVHVNTVVIDAPSLQLVRHHWPDKDTAAADPTVDTFAERLAKTLAGTRVNRMVLNAGQFEMTDDSSAMDVRIRDITLAIRDIRIDPASLLDTARLYFARAIRLEIDSLDFLRPDSLYRLHVGPLRFQTDTRELALRDLRYGLTVSKAEFYRRVQRAKDIAGIAVAHVALNDVNLARWVNSQTLAASVLRIDSGSIAVYKDKTKPNPPAYKIGESPHQQLLGMKQRLAIDSVLINAMDISFTEVSDQTAKAGTVTFDDVNGLIRNMTNDSVMLARNRFLQLDATSRVMGAGDLEVRFRFDLLDTLGAHTYQAKVGRMDGRSFNRMLTPQMNVEVEQADIQAMAFEMEANDRQTSGTLQLDYRNLKVSLLREAGNGETSARPVVSFFANRFLVNDSNPDANGIYHQGSVYLVRDPTYSFFKMIWHSIREGTKQCIGLEP
ncbi:hypothetical protein SAMN05660226_02768 [Parapedobacter luteus]|uniref:AsmA family protein n=1 Tax=Parapedobacter luteus TaxID=623280 RepID=A0A1T5DEW6_9SPHI|nr:hypothetical protein [Parapedobacter luteus]SKB70151.1 hypothetical protein SAMN05660226_02768 [Parapedobacter luteus]